MKSFKKIQLFLIVFMFLSVPLFAAVPAAAVRAGTVLDVAGEVSQLKNEREAKILPLKLNDDLLFNDSVMTGDASSTRLLLSPDEKRIKFYVHENSRLKIDPVLIKDGKKNFVTRFSQGLLRVITEKLEGDSVTIITPNATVGIRGTDLQITVAGGVTTVEVAGGIEVGALDRVRVEFKADIKKKEVVYLNSGMGLSVSTNPITGETTVTGPTVIAFSLVPDLVEVRDSDRGVTSYTRMIFPGRSENPKSNEQVTGSSAVGGTNVATICTCPDADPGCITAIAACRRQ
ncbi:MAG: FecR domain-containing protein [Deltaproteobacteria bacterium]